MLLSFINLKSIRKRIYFRKMEMSLPSTTTTTTTLPSSSSPSWSSLLSSEKDYKQSSFLAQFKRLFRQLRLRRLRRWPKLNCYSLITIFILMFILPFLLIYRLYWFRDFVYLIR
mgnify:CR=1 FL=1